VHLDQIGRKQSVSGLPPQNRANRRRFAYGLGPNKPDTFCLLCGALLVAMSLGAAGGSIEASTSQSEPRIQTFTQPALDRQIERVLQNPEYSWRQRDVPDAASPSQKQHSVFERWIASIRSMLVSLGDWMSRLLKALLKPFDLKPPADQIATPGASLASRLFNTLGYLLWAAFAGTLILFTIRILKLKATKLPSSINPWQEPDLADEEIKADRLPDNEWYALARQKMAAGEFRQAQRALFLAILSYLASHRFITVERWKSNTDYEKELGRKAKHLSELLPLFAQSRLGFERCRYGADPVTSADLENYNRLYERIKDAAA
jgi:hypothetical protein